MMSRRRRYDYLSVSMLGKKYETKRKKPARRSQGNLDKEHVYLNEFEDRISPELTAVPRSVFASTNETANQSLNPNIRQDEDNLNHDSFQLFNQFVRIETQNADELNSTVDSEIPNGIQHNGENIDESGNINDWNDFFNVFSKKNHSQFRVNSDIIIAEILFLVVNYYVRHNLSQDALEDLLKMLNVISGTKCFPENFETFASQFRNNPYDAKRVYFCTFCQYDFGTNLPKKGTLCPICKSQGHDFFVTIPIEPQLREMVLKYSLEIEQHSMEIENKNICDINRGRVARRLMKEHPEKHLTLSSNTDGAASRKSTTKKNTLSGFRYT
ncbi:uncharacterized protein LOC131429957 isoform X2 [Malaya genurostris]|uniref:uncharacterized protein LOC131429957 isoform X2 n=1 Tax=Malaya genurostris TaxID=325434 RepID=UPI0026F3D53F|nr:uncharacterized protein LOC131429957 isoform X2 [Malaya genurostris]